MGNPPFGKQSSLCHKFIRHASKFADSISFILPISFKKQFNLSEISNHFHLVNEVLITKNASTHNGHNFDIPTVFQIWKKQEVLRDKVIKEDPKNFSFVSKEKASFSIVRTGNAGRATTSFKDKSNEHNYFVKLTPGANVENVMKSVNETYMIERDFNLGAPTLSKREITYYLNRILSKYFIQT